MSKKSYDAFLDDLQRCEALGIKHYNFHPGAAGQSPLEEAIARLAGNLNKALAATTTVVPLLENMATRGSIIGGRFSDLSSVIKLIKPEFQHRIGVCIDTCHAFASGYDLRSPEAFKATLHEFDQTVGVKYLKALHLNDSKAPFASNRDLHQNIGVGFLGLRAFHNVMNEPRFQDLPLILETPCEKPDPDDPKEEEDSGRQVSLGKGNQASGEPHQHGSCRGSNSKSWRRHSATRARLSAHRCRSSSMRKSRRRRRRWQKNERRIKAVSEICLLVVIVVARRKPDEAKQRPRRPQHRERLACSAS